MEILMSQSRNHLPQYVKRNRANKSSSSSSLSSATATTKMSSSSTTTTSPSVTTSGGGSSSRNDFSDPLGNSNNSNGTTLSSFYNLTYFDNSTLYWNQSDQFNLTTNNSDLLLFDGDYKMFNDNVTSTTVGPWQGFCKDWTPAQHNLYQTANLFFAAAFLVPGSFKQSVLLVR